MSENVKRVYAHPEDYVWDDLVTDVHRACWTEFVPASDYDALLAERDAALDRARRAEETRENANAVSVRVELENRRLVAERDALREAGEALANALAPTRSAVRCGEGMSPALDRVGLEAFTAWRAATGKDA